MNGFGPVITAMVTPFDEHNQLNIKSMRKLIIHLLKHGSTSLVVTGTTGEAPTLSATEKLRVWETAVDYAGGIVPIIAGVGTNSTRTTLHNVRLAEEIGVDGLLVVVPYYNKPNQKGLLMHFKEVAKATSLPIILYNIPSRTGVGLELDTIVELAKMRNIVGIKDSSGDLNLLKQLKEVLPPDFALYTGDDTHYLDTLKLGGAGVISVASHIAGSQMLQVAELMEHEKVEQAEALNEKLHPLYRAMFYTANPIPIKGILNHMQMDVGPLRLPLVALDQFETAELFDTIQHLVDED